MGWLCNKCGEGNHNSVTTCKLCCAPRSGGGGYWQCKVCQYDGNWGRLCSECNTPRGETEASLARAAKRQQALQDKILHDARSRVELQEQARIRTLAFLEKEHEERAEQRKRDLDAKRELRLQAEREEQARRRLIKEAANKEREEAQAKERAKARRAAEREAKQRERAAAYAVLEAFCGAYIAEHARREEKFLEELAAEELREAAEAKAEAERALAAERLAAKLARKAEKDALQAKKILRQEAAREAREVRWKAEKERRRLLERAKVEERMRLEAEAALELATRRRVKVSSFTLSLAAIRAGLEEEAEKRESRRREDARKRQQERDDERWSAGGHAKSGACATTTATTTPRPLRVGVDLSVASRFELLVALCPRFETVFECLGFPPSYSSSSLLSASSPSSFARPLVIGVSGSHLGTTGTTFLAREMHWMLQQALKHHGAESQSPSHSGEGKGVVGLCALVDASDIMFAELCIVLGVRVVVVAAQPELDRLAELAGAVVGEVPEDLLALDFGESAQHLYDLPPSNSARSADTTGTPARPSFSNRCNGRKGRDWTKSVQELVKAQVGLSLDERRLRVLERLGVTRTGGKRKSSEGGVFRLPSSFDGEFLASGLGAVVGSRADLLFAVAPPEMKRKPQLASSVIVRESSALLDAAVRCTLSKGGQMAWVQPARLAAILVNLEARKDRFLTRLRNRMAAFPRSKLPARYDAIRKKLKRK